MNRSELRSRLREGINDPDGVFLTDAQANTLIDEGLEQLAEETRSVRRTAHVSVRPGMQFLYTPSIAEDVMFVTRIWNQTRSTRLIATSMTDLDRLETRWLNTTGDPEYWYPVSWDLVGIYPRPVAAGGVLRIDYIAWPPSLGDDNDTPEQANASHDVIALYGIYHGLLKKWDTQNAQTALAALKQQSIFAQGHGDVARQYQRMQTPHTPTPSGTGGLRGD